MINITNDPLMPHFLDIVSDPASAGLILAGGHGIRLKQFELQQSGTATLIEPVPEARATQDLDFFIRMELFINKAEGQTLRALIDRLGYRELSPLWQFVNGRTDQTYPQSSFTLDFLSRLPSSESVKARSDRVGKGADIGLHGRVTPEAFAIDDMPQTISIVGKKSDGVTVTAGVAIPHPYAWLNMKIKAAHDWLTTSKPNGEKHARDVYALVAMLTEREVMETQSLASRYATNEIAQPKQTKRDGPVWHAQLKGILGGRPPVECCRFEL